LRKKPQWTTLIEAGDNELEHNLISREKDGRMKIVLIVPTYSPHTGGIQVVVQQLASHLQKLGNSVCVVTNRYPRTLLLREEISGVSVLRFHFIFPRLHHLRQGRADLFLAGVLLFPFTMCRFAWFLYRFAPDIVNLHYLGSPSPFVLAIHKLMHFSLVCSLHGGDVEGEPFKNRFNSWLFRTLTKRAKAVTVCSQYLSERAYEIAPLLNGRTVVIHNGVNRELFSTAKAFLQDRPYLYCIGQLETHKGFDIAIQAFAQISKTFDTVDLLIGGTGTQKDFLMAEAKRLGLESSIRFLGGLDQKQVASYMRGSTAVVIPSRRESFGIVALEARAASATVVACAVGGLKEALEGYPALWVPPDSVDELGVALASILSERIRAHPLKHARTTSVSPPLDWSDSADMYLQVYEAAK
jgi:glycosyltransferase involved in cell wall biosynthesis